MPDKSITNRSMPSCIIIPVLAYNDVAKAITWLCDTFGFTIRWRAGDHRAQLAYGEGAIAVSSQRVHKQNTMRTDPGSLQETSLMVRVTDLDAHYEHATQHGAIILEPPADFPYGERQYTAVDPEGHIWTFSQSIADLAPEEWGAN